MQADYRYQRVGIFIDVSNMYHSAKALFDSHVNFPAIVEAALDKRQLIRAIAYVIKSDAPKEQNFFEALEKSGIEVRSKDLQVMPGGVKKGDWDVGLTVDAIRIAERLDVVILATGDGDYLPLVMYLKENKGCRVEGISFKRTTSSRLIENLDRYIDLESNQKTFLLK